MFKKLLVLSYSGNNLSNRFSPLIKIGEISVYKYTTFKPMNVLFKQFQGLHFENDKSVKLNWHLNRIVNKNDEGVEFKHTNCNTNPNTIINHYIIDTGVSKNDEFNNSNIKRLYNVLQDGKDEDCNGHGTHVAGLIASKTYGVCKDAKIFAVKSLDCEGSGTTSGVIKSLSVILNHLTSQSNKTKGIINMSLGGSFSYTLNKLIEQAVSRNNNIFFIVASGNENANSCFSSPTSSKSVLSVMATDKLNNRAYFSNYGTCSDIYAPGVDIVSTYLNNGIASLSGTSMATPIVSGVVAKYINRYPHLNFKELKKTILNYSTKDIVLNNKRDTPNRFIYDFIN
jgi:subtilisin family serine protease